MQADSAGFLDACHQNSVQMVEDAADFKLAMLRHHEQIAAQLGVQTLVMDQMKQEQQRTSQQLVRQLPNAHASWIVRVARLVSD